MTFRSLGPQEEREEGKKGEKNGREGGKRDDGGNEKWVVMRRKVRVEKSPGRNESEDDSRTLF